MVRAKHFRADLYQRIATIVITVPPLRERREDIPEIAYGFWLDNGWGRLTKEQLDALSQYDYPGNVRELINILDRARALEETDFSKLMREHKEISRELWAPDMGEEAAAFPEDLKAAMTAHVKQVFERHGRSMTEARKALGISLNTLKKYLEA